MAGFFEKSSTRYVEIDQYEVNNGTGVGTEDALVARNLTVNWEIFMPI